jgi:polynucleotide 5'-hydroxyl-kinase GRC3/NOL9
MDRLPPLPADLDIPDEWRKLALDLFGGAVLLVGATDTGKSTLARWLFEETGNRGKAAAWLDGDLGQSSLGIPGTLNIVSRPSGPTGAEKRTAFFVGSHSPRGHMLPVLTGLCRLLDRAREEGADKVFIDTSGLVAEELGGGALKEWEVELLKPTTVIALQRGQELEHLLAPWRSDPRLKLHILPVAAGVRRRSAEQRAERRQFLFRRYFSEAGLLRIDKEQKAIYGLGNAEPGCLAGLIDREGFLLGAGVVKRIAADGLELLSTCPSTEQAAVVRVGKLRVDPRTGAERQRHKDFSISSEDEE